MSILEEWPHRWFGIWQEFGPAYDKCPKALTFVCAEVNAMYNKRLLRQYLTTAQVVASTSRLNFANPFTGERHGGSISFRTDGRWLWLDDLADYIDYHDVAIPTAWLKEIETYGYVPPQVSSDLIAKLEWPTTKGNR